MRPIPLFGSGVRSISDVVTRQRRLNCFYDIRVDGDKSNVVILGTPGHYVFCELPTYPVYGFHRMGHRLHVVSGQVLYEVTEGGAYTALGSLPTTASNVDIDDNTAQLIIVDGVAGYVYTFSTGVVSTITDSNFPNGATSVAYLGSFFYANVPGTREFRQSASYDGTTWTPLVFGTKEDHSDVLLELDNYNGTLVLMGETSTEFWSLAGTSPLVVQKVPGTTSSWGLGAIYSHKIAGNSFIFLGQDPDGGSQVVQLNGYVPTPISTSDVDYAIKDLPEVYDAIALVYSTGGHSMYQLTFPSGNKTFVYDLKTQLWHEQQTGTGLTGRHAGNLGVSFDSKNFISDSTSGIIYRLDDDQYTDNGVLIKREVCTKHIYSDGNQVTLDQLLLELETGVGNTDCVNPQIAIQVSRDGGRTWGPEKWTTLGNVGQYYKRALFNRLGAGTDLVIKITMSDPVKFVLVSGKANVEVGND